MADAKPTEWGGRPSGWYGKTNLQPVDLKRPKAPTRIERVKCPACDLSYKLSDVEPTAKCECGQLVEL
jgi:hypothetical protein